MVYHTGFGVKGLVYELSTHAPTLCDVGEFFNLLELQFLHLWYQVNNSYLVGISED